MKKNVTANIKAEMARANVKQAQVAAALNLSQAATSRRLTGRTPWRVGEVQILTEVLGVPMSALLPSENRDDTAVAS